MKFDQEFIERVRSTSNLVELIGQYTQLRKAGSNLMGLCPFPSHVEKTPSFSVSETKQVYHCFGCKKSGNVFSFLEDYLGLSFPEAVEYLARRSGIELPKTFASDQPQQNDRRNLLSLNRFAAQFYLSQWDRIEGEHPARLFLKKRRLGKHVLERFSIGVALSNWSDLSERIVKKTANVSAAERLGLIRQRSTGTGHYDLFRERVIFPIQNASGDYVGFGGRSYGDGQPKYLNSPESQVFMKGQTLYGLNETAKFIRSADEVIVVEGYMDLLSLYSHGIENVVATMGTALTADHCQILKRHTKNVVVLFDNDDAGRSAQEKSLSLLLDHDLLPRTFDLPEGQDPDDFINLSGREEFLRRKAAGKDLFLVIFERKLRAYQGNPSEKATLISELLPLLKKVGDPLLAQLYAQEISLQLQMDSKILTSQLNSTASVKSSPKPHSATMASGAQKQQLKKGQAKASQDQPKAELYLLNLCLLHQDCLELCLREEGLLTEFESDEIRGAFEYITETYRQDRKAFDNLTALLVSRGIPAEWVTRHLDRVFSGLDLEGMTKLTADCVRKVRESAILRKSDQLARELRRNSSQNSLEQFMNIHQGRRALFKE